MSGDTVDLLHDAEDRVVQLEGLLGRMVDEFATEQTIDDALVAEARETIEPPYCRYTCSDDNAAVHDEDCGCPCHWVKDGG